MQRQNSVRQNRPEQGGTERPEKCLETGKQQNPLWGKTVPHRGAPNDLLDV